MFVIDYANSLEGMSGRFAISSTFPPTPAPTEAPTPLPTPEPTLPPTPSPTLTFFSYEPDSYSAWATGETHVIIWRYNGDLAGATGRVTLRLYLDGNFEATIASLLDAGITTYSWTIPVALAWGDTYSVRAQDADNGLNVYSDSFIIAPPPTAVPSPSPTHSPAPTAVPTSIPIAQPTSVPIPAPSAVPAPLPTPLPTPPPTSSPLPSPTALPTALPTM